MEKHNDNGIVLDIIEDEHTERLPDAEIAERRRRFDTAQRKINEELKAAGAAEVARLRGVV